MNHKFPCECLTNHDSCHICRGAHKCKVCGGLGDTLTNQCCGRPLTEEEIGAIENGFMDFRCGKWWEWIYDKKEF